MSVFTKENMRKHALIGRYYKQNAPLTVGGQGYIESQKCRLRWREPKLDLGLKPLEHLHA
jgi:hypothetical protein